MAQHASADVKLRATRRCSRMQHLYWEFATTCRKHGAEFSAPTAEIDNHFNEPKKSLCGNFRKAIASE
jgi:hypothetical protein